MQNFDTIGPRHAKRPGVGRLKKGFRLETARLSFANIIRRKGILTEGN